MLDQTDTAPTQVRNGIVVLSSQSDQPMGYAIGGLRPGPVIAVCGEGPGAETLFSMLRNIHTLPYMRGTLLLVFTDNTSWAPLKTSLKDLGHSVIDHVYLLPFTLGGDIDAAGNDTPITQAYWSVLRRCADYGMIAGRGIPGGHDR